MRWDLLIATIGLGSVISDIAYSWNCSFRISVVSCMDSAWPLQWQEKEKQETVYHEECIYTPVCTAIALQSIHFFLSLLQQHCIFSPTHPCLCIYIAMFHSRSISNRYGSLLRCGNGPEYTFRGYCSAYLERRDRSTTVAATSLCIACGSRGSNVANEALISIPEPRNRNLKRWMIRRSSPHYPESLMEGGLERFGVLILCQFGAYSLLNGTMDLELMPPSLPLD